jgi:hypothetical protein
MHLMVILCSGVEATKCYSSNRCGTHEQYLRLGIRTHIPILYLSTLKHAIYHDKGVLYHIE